jgi:ATP-binding cassette subfamily B protein
MEINMLKIMKYLKPYILLAIISPLLMIGEVVGDLLLPYLMSYIVNYGITGMDINDPVTGSKMAFRLIEIFGGGDYSRMHMIIVFGALMLLITLIGGTFGVTCAATASTGAQGFVRAPMFLIGGFLALIGLNLSFSMVVICLLPVLVTVIWAVLRKAIPQYALVQKRLDKVNSVVQENVNGMRVVKVYNKEDYECERFGRANDELIEKRGEYFKLYEKQFAGIAT